MDTSNRVRNVRVSSVPHSGYIMSKKHYSISINHHLCLEAIPIPFLLSASQLWHALAGAAERRETQWAALERPILQQRCWVELPHTAYWPSWLMQITKTCKLTHIHIQANKSVWISLCSHGKSSISKMFSHTVLENICPIPCYRRAVPNISCPSPLWNKGVHSSCWADPNKNQVVAL